MPPLTGHEEETCTYEPERGKNKRELDWGRKKEKKNESTNKRNQILIEGKEIKRFKDIGRIEEKLRGKE